MSNNKVSKKFALYSKFTSFEEAIDFINYFPLMMLKDESFKISYGKNLEDPLESISDSMRETLIKDLENRETVAVIVDTNADIFNVNIMDVFSDHIGFMKYIDDDCVERIKIEDDNLAIEWVLNIYDAKYTSLITVADFNNGGCHIMYYDEHATHSDVLMRIFVPLDENGNEVRDNIFERFKALTDILKSRAEAEAKELAKVIAAEEESKQKNK